MKSRIGLALGCGGTVGYAWSLGALRRLEEQTGWDAREAHAIVGTSAGSVLGALLGAGMSVADLLAAEGRRSERERRGKRPDHLPPPPRGGPLSPRLALEGLARGLPLLAAAALLPAGRADASRFVGGLERVVPAGAWVRHPRTWAVALDVASGERVAFGREGAPPASIHEAVAASCAVPGWIAPVTIGGRRYIDGGAFSSASVDLLADEGLDEIVLVSPMTSARFAAPASLGQVAERVMRAAMTRRLDEEVRMVEARGIAVLRIEPTSRDLALMGANFMDARRVPHVLAAWG